TKACVAECLHTKPNAAVPSKRNFKRPEPDQKILALACPSSILTIQFTGQIVKFCVVCFKTWNGVAKQLREQVLACFGQLLRGDFMDSEIRLAAFQLLLERMLFGFA